MEARALRGDTGEKMILIQAVSIQAAPGDDDEISCNGKLYDVAQKVVAGDSVYYYGIEDTREEEVTNNLTSHFQHNGCITGLHRSASIDYFPVPPGAAIDVYRAYSAILFLPVIGDCSLGYPILFTPPPKQLHAHTLLT